MNFLVTGGLGYIGTVLCDALLSRGSKVVCVDNLRYGQGRLLSNFVRQPDFRFVKADAANVGLFLPEVDKADVIVPLAALVGGPVCNLYKYKAEETNLTAVARLVEAAGPSKRIVFPMTNSGYGQTDGSSEVTEESPLGPISHYGTTKAEAEKIVLGHPNAVSLRLATVFGVPPRMRFDLLVNDLVARLMQATHKESVVIYEPDFWRNFVHVRDVVSAIMFMACRTHTGVFNLGDSRANRTKAQLAGLICDTLGLEQSLWRVGEGRDPDQRNYRVSNAKFEAAGFRCYYSLEDGIREVGRLLDHISESDVAEARNVLEGE